MSHNVSVTGVKVTDLNALEEAVKELNSELNMNMEFIRAGGKMRGYYSQYNKNQNDETVDVLIRCNGHNYDIGFNKNQDGSYSPRYEDMSRHDFGKKLGAKIGAKTVEGNACDIRSQESNIGILLQRTNVVVAENEAARSGMSCMREVDASTGLISVIAEIY